MEELPKIEEFNRENSHAREAYFLLSAYSPLELSNLYSDEDQKLMKSGSWDYENPNLIINKVKDILETVDNTIFTENEREWTQEILWFWYHHAVSCAIWRYNDKEAAQKFATIALEKQPVNHPNTITRLLYFLVNDKLKEAEKYITEIREEPEKSTAESLMKEYKETQFFKN